MGTSFKGSLLLRRVFNESEIFSGGFLGSSGGIGTHTITSSDFPSPSPAHKHSQNAAKGVVIVIIIIILTRPAMSVHQPTPPTGQWASQFLAMYMAQSVRTHFVGQSADSRALCTGPVPTMWASQSASVSLWAIS